MTRYRVRHETRYRYGEPVVTSTNEARLLPRRLPHQEVERIELRILPNPDTVTWHQDYFGNDVVFFGLQSAHESLVIRTDSRVDLEPRQAPDADRSPPWEQVARSVRDPDAPEALEAFEFLFDSPFVEAGTALAEYARPSFPEGRSLAAGVLDLSRRVHGEFRYDQEATTLDTSLREVLEGRHGVCQDFAHVMIGGLRSLGLPARYVSGYLRTTAGASEEAAEDAGTELIGADASHAWVAAWCPVLGWIEVDPTNDLVPSDRHVTLGWGRDYDDVSPVKGVTVGGGDQTVSVSVDVSPL
ncbi:MAG: transglutaminase family protein [Myxococcota bacterium]|nr:transglutaminase family protein [Myxococcota bacterium]